MKTRLFLFISLFIAVIGCEKPNPEPEKMDSVYEAMNKFEDEAKKEADAAKKELAGFEKDLEAVAPQTGQIKYAQKRVWDTQKRIEKAEQMEKYWRFRAASRKSWARDSYLKAYNAKIPWPPPGELEAFKKQLEYERIPRAWNVKERIALATPPKPKGGGGHEGGGEGKPPAEEKKSGH